MSGFTPTSVGGRWTLSKMPQLEQYLTSTQRDAIRATAQRRDVCGCGKAKSPAHLTCPSCSRHVGPFVLVESPSGDYVEVGGLESAESLLNRNATKTVQV